MPALTWSLGRFATLAHDRPANGKIPVNDVTSDAAIMQVLRALLHHHLAHLVEGMGRDRIPSSGSPSQAE